MSLRVQTSSQNHESRPSPRDTKISDDPNRWDSIGMAHHCCHYKNSDNCDCHYHQNRDRTASNNSEISIMTSSSCSSTMIPATISSNPPYHNSGAIRAQQSGINCSRHTASIPSGDQPNVMQWMQNDCPKDVLPLILAYAGPQKFAAVGKTSRFWRRVMDQEETWSRLCESLYKVRPTAGKEIVSRTVADIFCLNQFSFPLVFALFSSVERRRRYPPIMESLL